MIERLRWQLENESLIRLDDIIQERVNNLENKKSSYSKGKLNAYKDILNLLKLV
ncbi:hypothetical protein [Clostridium sp. ZBS18]|uniref:hypothetical protein n=1 Tax=Clostridium sp. ZBS18 TaxID=2949967 RepID=UPI00207A7AA9|nr:hypothetical protein [Clostridium sp. ZBS18]